MVQTFHRSEKEPSRRTAHPAGWMSGVSVMGRVRKIGHLGGAQRASGEGLTPGGDPGHAGGTGTCVC